MEKTSKKISLLSSFLKKKIKGVDIKEIVKKTGLSKYYIQEITSGKRATIPTESSLKKIMSFLELTEKEKEFIIQLVNYERETDGLIYSSDDIPEEKLFTLNLKGIKVSVASSPGGTARATASTSSEGTTRKTTSVSSNGLTETKTIITSHKNIKNDISGEKCKAYADARGNIACASAGNISVSTSPEVINIKILNL